MTNLAAAPHLIHWQANARNGMVPSSHLWRRIVGAQNYLAAYGVHRMVYRKTWPLGVNGSVGTTTIARARVRTNRSADRLVVRAVLAADDVGTEVNPYVNVLITKSGGATQTLTFYGGSAGAASSDDAPDSWTLQELSAAADPDAVYEIAIERVDYGRLLAIEIHEATTASIDESLGFNADDHVAGQPIYAEARRKMLAELSAMYRRGGIHAHWSLADGGARTRSSATYINLVDNATTGSPTAATPGWVFNTVGKRTASRSVIPVELAVYGSMTGAGDGSLGLIDSGGGEAILIEVGGGSPLAWYTQAGFIDADQTGVKYDLQYKGDGTGTFTVHAVSLIEWETGP